MRAGGRGQINEGRVLTVVSLVVSFVGVQGKTVVQAEIDAAAELIDFFRFNAKHAIELQRQQPLDAEGSANTLLYRGLEVKIRLHRDFLA